MVTINELQTQAENFLKLNDAPTAQASMHAAPGLKFSPFHPALLEKALQVSDQLMALADSESEEERGLEKVLQEADRLAREEDLGLIKYALMVFITHHRRGSRLPIPALEERSPGKFLIGRRAARFARRIRESQLDWYREDVLANAHHEHWHVVYPRLGIPDGSGGRKIKDRQGELFFYMHQQMLARYDTERLALALAQVKPLSSYHEKIPEAYDSGLEGYSARPSGLQFSDIQRDGINYAVKDLELRRDRMLKAVDNKFFEKEDGTKIDDDVNPDLLGATEESSFVSVSGGTHTSFYGNHHGFGHLFSSMINDPRGSSPPGVMIDTATAIRDPIFYRWHKHVDDFSFRWQELQQPNDLSDGPQVLIRKHLDDATFQSPDIILSFKKSIPGSDNPEFNGFAYAEKTFGGENWDKDFSSTDTTTDELHTMMLEREIQLGDGNLNATVSYLDQKEFCYFIRVENMIDRPKDVTVRIFLAAKSKARDRRMWIEMDKFRYKLGPLRRTVIFRSAENSSVIRKPGTKPPKPIKKSGGESGANYCNCGWPYNLLLPRGTHKGMPFRLMVMFTDWEKDKVENDTACGSMSFCGARDRYPDSRGMGYPFDRPFPIGHSIAQTIKAHNNMAARDIKIRWI